MVSAKGLLSLVLFTFHNALAALLMRYTQMHHRNYNNVFAVFLQEAAVKLPCCVLLYAHECGGVVEMTVAVREDFRREPRSWFQVLIPALLYTTQNNLVYYGYTNLDASIGMITYQTKLIFTATCSVVLLGKRLGAHQWFAVTLLLLGIVCVHAFPATTSAVPTKRVRHIGGHHVHKQVVEAEEPQDPLLGALAFLVAAFCTASASVYFELMIKGRANNAAPDGPPPERASLWLRSMQLSFFSSLIAAGAVIWQGDALAGTRRAGIFHGISFMPVLCILWNGGGGLLVAVTVKYADNILRGFAQGFAILLGALGSYVLFGLQLTPLFSIGGAFVLLSIPIYEGIICHAPFKDFDEGRAPFRCCLGAHGAPI
jgi:UDP-sugar transporter A1/2/3